MSTKARETADTVEKRVTKNEATKVAVFGVQRIYMRKIEVSYA